MAYTILALVLIVALVLAVTKKEWLLYYFVFLYPILPEYFAIDISSSLPLFTGSRLLFLILFVVFLFESKLRISYAAVKNSKMLIPLGVYFLINTLLLIVHISNRGNIKGYFSFLLEELLFLLCLTNLIKTKKVFQNCMRALVASAVFVFVCGISEPLTKINLASTFLNTWARDTVLMSSYERYGSIRAVFSFGHAICLAVFCVAFIPQLLNIVSKKKATPKSLMIFLLGLGCLLMTISRACIAIGIVVLILFVMNMNKRERNRVLKAAGILGALGIIGLVCVPPIRNIAINSVLGTLNAFGAKFQVGASGNDNAISSRLDQLTLIPQVLTKYPFFGAGSNYLTNSDLNLTVYTATRSYKAVSVDMEYLSWLLGNGIVGFAAYFFLWFSVLKTVYKNAKRYKDSDLKALFWSIAAMMICYMSVNQLTTNRIFWIFIALAISKIQINKRSEEWEVMN